MADAEIIPIGTRGRPGRGTGSAKPSASARSLAGTGARSRPGASSAPKARSARAEQEEGTATSPVAEVPPAAGTRSAKPGAAKPGATNGSSRSTRTTKQTTKTTKTPKATKPGATKPGATKPGAAKPGATRTPAAEAPAPSAETSAGTTFEPPVDPSVDAAAAQQATDQQTTDQQATDQQATGPQDAGQQDAGKQDDGTQDTGPGWDEPGDRRTSSAFTEDRGDGIPVTDWIEAFSIASKELFGEDWEPRLAEFLAFLRKRLSGDYAVDEYGFDPELTERFFYAAIRPIAEKWFRVEVRGAENIPAEGGALVVSNHSGTIPVDGLVTGVSIFDHTGRHLRPLGADLVFRLPIVGELARRGGATLACNEDAERMLRGGELVGVWPEGFKGIGKPYSDRYKLQRFGRGGFVSAALRTGVPIIPCSVVGAEEIYPLVGNLPSLARLLGVPYIPITPFFPALGLLGLIPLPSKWLIEFGEPIRTDSYDNGAADDPMLVFNVTDQVRETIQQTLYSLLMQRRSVFH